MTQSDIIAKVQKLLKLSTNNANENEAAAAARAAEKLIAEHRLEGAQLELENETPAVVEQVVPELLIRKTEMWRQSLLTRLCHLHDVAVIASPRTNGSTYDLFGTKGDIEITLTVFRWLVGEIDRLARVYTRGENASFKRSYKLGAVSIVVEMMKTADVEANRAAPTGVALALVNRFGLAKDLAAKTFPYTVKGRAPKPVRLDAYSQGREDGRNINVHGATNTRRLS